MNNEKVCNPKVEVPETTALNDRDYLDALLENLKNMSNNYSIALNECSNEKMYEEVFSMLEDVKDEARGVYDVMFSNGWYTLEKAEQQKFDEKKNELNGKMSQLGQA